MAEQAEQTGFFEGLLMLIGGFTGALWGSEQGDIWLTIIGAVVVGGIGKWVGRVADGLVKLAVLIALILLNSVIRQFIWGVIQSIFQNA